MQLRPAKSGVVAGGIEHEGAAPAAPLWFRPHARELDAVLLGVGELCGVEGAVMEVSQLLSLSFVDSNASDVRGGACVERHAFAAQAPPHDLRFRIVDAGAEKPVGAIPALDHLAVVLRRQQRLDFVGKHPRMSAERARTDVRF